MIAWIGWPRCEACKFYYGTDMAGYGDCTKHNKEVRSYMMCSDFYKSDEYLKKVMKPVGEMYGSDSTNSH